MERRNGHGSGFIYLNFMNLTHLPMISSSIPLSVPYETFTKEPMEKLSLIKHLLWDRRLSGYKENLFVLYSRQEV